MINFAQLAGLDDQCIDRQSLEVPVHQELVPHLQRLREAAAGAGFELALASGYRPFDRQLAIWNAKAQGQRPVLDDSGEPLDVNSLSDRELVYAILRWSALPGGSRHHWGTDVDVYDAAPCKAGYRLQLTHAETQPGGACAAFHEWLDLYLAQPNCAFFRPYQSWRGGVAPEPWHLSWGPLAAQYQQRLVRDALHELILQQDIALKDTIVACFDDIFTRYVWVNWHLYPAAAQPDQQ